MKIIDGDELINGRVFLCGGPATDPYYNGYADALDRVSEAIEQLPSINAVVLPCEVGDPVWLTHYWNGMNFLEQNPPISRCVQYFGITKKGVVMHFHDGCIGVDSVGEFVFLTLGEAKAALTKMDGGTMDGAD